MSDCEGFPKDQEDRASRSEGRPCRQLRVALEGRGGRLLGDPESWRHTLKTWPSTEVDVAMSPAEAELYAMTEGATRGMDMKTIVSEMSVVLDGAHLFAGSSAANLLYHSGACGTCGTWRSKSSGCKQP